MAYNLSTEEKGTLLNQRNMLVLNGVTKDAIEEKLGITSVTLKRWATELNYPFIRINNETYTQEYKDMCVTKALQLYKPEMSLNTLASMIPLKPSALRSFLNERNIKLGRGQKRYSDLEIRSILEAAKKLLNTGLTKDAVEKKVGVSFSTMYMWANKYDFDLKMDCRKRKRKRNYSDNEKLNFVRVAISLKESGLSCEGITKETGVSYKLIAIWAKEYNLFDALTYIKKVSVSDDLNLIEKIEQQARNGVFKKDICIELGRSIKWFNNFLKKYNREDINKLFTRGSINDDKVMLVNKAIEHLHSGESFNSIAKSLCVCDSTLVSLFKKTGNFEVYKKYVERQKFSISDKKAKVEEAKKRILDGEYFYVVAEKLGLNCATLERWFKQLDLDFYIKVVGRAYSSEDKALIMEKVFNCLENGMSILDACRTLNIDVPYQTVTRWFKE